MDAAASAEIRERRRPIMRLAVRKLHRQGKIDRAQMRAILDDDDMLDAVIAGADDFQPKDDAEAAKPKFGSLTDFFQWLMDHADELIALIQKIIAFFSTP